MNQGMQHHTQKAPLITPHGLASEVSIWGDLGTPDIIINLPDPKTSLRSNGY